MAKSTEFWKSLDLEKYERLLILSPHLDDAALSCGGLIMQTKGIISRLVITICSGDPPSSKQGKRSKGRSIQIDPKIRRREDISAMHFADCDFVHLGFSDAIYRRSSTSGKLIYANQNQTWDGPRVDDASHIEELFLILNRLCKGMGKLLIFTPLGIGSHVDHVICTQIACRLLMNENRLMFYEDFPYILKKETGEERKGQAYEALSQLGFPPSERMSLTYNLAKKAELISHYKSQVPILFGSHPELMNQLEQTKVQGEPKEFYWKPKNVPTELRKFHHASPRRPRSKNPA